MDWIQLQRSTCKARPAGITDRHRDADSAVVGLRHAGRLTGPSRSVCLILPLIAYAALGSSMTLAVDRSLWFP